jgi:hypothetical protein
MQQQMRLTGYVHSTAISTGRLARRSKAAVELEPWVCALCDEHACGAIIPSCCEIRSPLILHS